MHTEKSHLGYMPAMTDVLITNKTDFQTSLLEEKGGVRVGGRGGGWGGGEKEGTLVLIVNCVL